MDSIELMKEEHKFIKRGLKVIRKICIAILETGKVSYDDFVKMIDFIRNYADKHHHSKEENILFKKMEEELGEKVKAPLSGMLVEHDLGRLFISNLEEALKKFKEGDMEARVDIIANSIGYCDLLNRHIDKEDNAIYNFAKRSLSEASLKEIEDRCIELEDCAGKENTQNNYIKMLEQLEEKWIK